MLEVTSARFSIETGTRVLVQVPKEAMQRVMSAILEAEPLTWGDYDQVAFTTSEGVQQFRSTGGGINAATDHVVEVPCAELQFFVPKSGQALEPLLRGIYHAHPYEEPVIQLVPSFRSLHIRGQDEGNPNRFWNRETADWVPEAHRK
ncbi:hypothetical protein RSK20926_06312 [Roseobacter sp. SK209-2-6]|uniref:hypothetical protein n=1 Tax=Roseobacter sp. SK209-2-6 TaxID=388739 RepID=UPI0000F3D733|nr:hypothetical protein [Roseobacter sp. SK209-2-6]EBA17327.1 hypothetical protein RSK20926_06312 [Roseobacter sp. SK209-2-6]